MVLKVNNISLPLKYTPMGPLLSTEDKFLEPIAWIINPAAAGGMPQLADCLERGEDVFMPKRMAVRPQPEDDDLEEARAQWRELTGEEPGEDVYIVGTGFTTHEVVLPRQTLLSILQALLELRAEFPEPPFPWLFRRSPYHLAPATGGANGRLPSEAALPSEEEWVCKLEERAAMFKKFLEQEESAPWAGAIREGVLRDLSAAGLFSEAYFEEKQMWLEIWECPTLLSYHQAALRFLNHFRNQVEQVIPNGVESVPVLSASIEQEQLELSYDQGWLMRTTEARRGLVSREAVLNVNNLCLPLIGTPFGPVLATKNKSLESIAWIVNSALGNNISHFTESLARGEDIFLQHPLIAVRPTSLNDLEDARTQWRELTGSELGEDVYMVSSRFTDDVVLPRQTLLDLVQTLRQLRAEFPDPPFPWLFRRNSYEMAPADGEKELVCDLEKRAAASKQNADEINAAWRSIPVGQKALLRDLSEAGIFSEAYFNEKQRYLERWRCPTLLTYHKAALEFLNHFSSSKSQAIPRGALPVPVLSVSISIDQLSFPYIPRSSAE